MKQYQSITPMSMWAEDDKPAYKLQNKGSLTLSNAEILSLIIARNTSEFNSLDAAKALLSLNENNLIRLGKANLKFFTDNGISQSIAIRIMAAFEMGRRAHLVESFVTDKIVQSRQAYEIFKSVMGSQLYEQFWIILMNRGNRIIKTVKISEGGITDTVVDPKKIFKIAIDNYASSFVMGHNHPSGHVSPSDADRKLTIKIKNAGILLDIDVLDHIIMADTEYHSFADNGEM